MLLLSITVVVDEGGGRRAALAKSEDSERFWLKESSVLFLDFGCWRASII